MRANTLFRLLNGAIGRDGKMRRFLIPCCIVALCACLLAGCASETGSTAGSGSQSASLLSSEQTGSTASSGAAVSDKVSSSQSKSDNSSESATSAVGSGKSVPTALKKRVRSVLQQAPLQASFCYVDLDSGAQYSVAGGKQMVSASSIKLLILAAFLDQVNAGRLSMDDTYTLKAADLVGGTGSLQNRTAGSTVTLREAARLMITESDNVAANILIDIMGTSAINKEASKLGLAGTQLNRRMMQSNGAQNYMTAADAALILKDIYRGKLASRELSAFALKCLEEQTDDQGFLAGLPQGTSFAHKTGNLSSPDVRNDAGIVEGDHPYILVAFTEGSSDSALQVMKSLAQAVEEKR